MPDESSNKSSVTIIVAVIGALGAVMAAYIARDQGYKASNYQQQVIDTRGDLRRLSNRYDSLLTAYNHLIQQYKAIAGSQASPISSGSIGQNGYTGRRGLPDSARAGAHFILLESVIGNSRDHTVTAKFKLTNEQADRIERIYMSGTIGIANAVTYHAQRSVLDSAPGEGPYGASGYARLIKGEPLNASVTLTDVPSDVTAFSTFIIGTEGDDVRFKNVPITWQ